MPLSAMASLSALTARLRIWPSTPSAVKRELVPNTSRIKAAGSLTRKEKDPNARTRIMPNSLSRIITGLAVPHLRSMNCRVETKYTSLLKGELKPNFHARSAVITGRLRVVSS